MVQAIEAETQPLQSVLYYDGHQTKGMYGPRYEMPRLKMTSKVRLLEKTFKNGLTYELFITVESKEGGQEIGFEFLSQYDRIAAEYEVEEEKKSSGGTDKDEYCDGESEEVF